MAKRVVMLVDNTVYGDSRVEKAARSTADAGWDTTLVGRSPDRREERTTLGAAALVRVPIPLRIAGSSRSAADRAAARAAEVAWARLDLASRPGAGVVDRIGLAAGVAASSARRQLQRVRSRQPTRLRSPVHRDRQWRWDVPSMADYELAMAPVIDELAPDLIHAHDFRMIGTAVRAANRLGRRGHRPKVVYDAHEYLPGIGLDDARVARGYESWERVHITEVDAVVTVSEPLADLLMTEHRLPARPTVVLNAPVVGRDGIAIPDSDVRTDAHVPAGAPLIVYVGVSAAKRGLDTMVEALPRLPHAHLVLVTRQNDFVTGLQTRAVDLGAGERLHVLPYVDADDVSGYIRTATVGVHGLIHLPNHELALPTKLFQYAHARLPVVVSDVELLTRTVHETGIGEVFAVGDVDSFAAAAARVCADPDGYRAGYDRPGLLGGWTWEVQAAALDQLYHQLLGPVSVTTP